LANAFAVLHGGSLQRDTMANLFDFDTQKAQQVFQIQYSKCPSRKTAL
jgi:hypothetical protein